MDVSPKSYEERDVTSSPLKDSPETTEGKPKKVNL